LVNLSQEKAYIFYKLLFVCNSVVTEAQKYKNRVIQLVEAVGYRYCDWCVVYVPTNATNKTGCSGPTATPQPLHIEPPRTNFLFYLAVFISFINFN
jgi:hypothetical protein